MQKTSKPFSPSAAKAWSQPQLLEQRRGDAILSEPQNPVDRQGIDRFDNKNYCSVVKVRDIVKLIEQDGWHWVRTKGSHHQYRHQTKPGLVTIPGKPGDDVAAGTLNNILKQAGLKP